LLAAALLALGLLPNIAAALPAADFDADGISDATSVAVDENGDLAWSCRLSSTQVEQDLGMFGAEGDGIILGHWNDDTTPVLGVVYKNDATDSVTWEVADGQTAVDFGTPEDLLIAGADFDNSGKMDPAVVSRNGAKLTWTIKYDLLSGLETEPVAQAFAFGVVGEKPLFVNYDGTGDWLTLLSQPRLGSYALKFLNPRTGIRRRTAITKAVGRAGRPVPVAQADGSDLLVFAKVARGATKLFTIAPNGAPMSTASIAAVGTLVVGEYDLSQPGEEVGVATASATYVLNPVTRVALTITRNASVPVDEVNIIALSGEEDSVINGCVPEKPSGGFVWKPNSDTSYFAVAVMPGSIEGQVKKVEVFSKRGALVKQLTYYGCGNPDSNGKRCNFKDFALTGADYKRKYGGIILKVTLKRGCRSYSIPNPAVRVD